MKTILYIVSTLKRSGPTNQLFNIINNLDSADFKPVLLTLSPEHNESMWPEFDALGIAMHSLNLSRIGGVFLARVRLGSFVKIIKPDLIHTQGFRADVLSSKINAYIPKVATVRNFPQIDFKMTYGKILGAWMVRRQTAALSRLNYAVGVSEAVASNLKNAFLLRNIRVVPNGVDVNKYMPAESGEKYKIRSELGLPVDHKIWIVSGHLNERKDPGFIIDMWRDITNETVPNTLLFIGDGDLLGLCQEKARGSPNIIVVGRVPNVVDYLKASDFYISASKAEGLPNAALEAMACGLPVLLSSIGPHEEIYRMSDRVGVLFDIGDEEGFKSSFNLLSSTDYATSSQAAVDFIEKSLSAEEMSSKYQDLYIELSEG